MCFLKLYGISTCVYVHYCIHFMSSHCLKYTFDWLIDWLCSRHWSRSPYSPGRPCPLPQSSPYPRSRPALCGAQRHPVPPALTRCPRDPQQVLLRPALSSPVSQQHRFMVSGGKRWLIDAVMHSGEKVVCLCLTWSNSVIVMSLFYNSHV